MIAGRWTGWGASPHGSPAMERSLTARVCAILPLGVAVAGVSAQTTLQTFDETQPEATAGLAVALWEDVNGDGQAEWAVGIPGKDGAVPDGGEVVVLSGATGAQVLSWVGAGPADRLGSALANVGDLDGDGRDELAMGAEGAREVQVLSGANAAVLWTRHEPSRSLFGCSVAPAGDVDGDGTPDVIVGARGAHTAMVLSGLDGSVIFVDTRPTSWSHGWSVASAGDIDGDGFGDVVVGSPAAQNGFYNEGRVHVLRGPSGALAHVHAPADVNDRGQEFGFSVAPAGDVDGDGLDDYAVGARYYGALHYIADNFVSVYSGVTHLPIATIAGHPDTWFGYSMANVGDVDLDGHGDLAIGNPLRSEVVVWSPRRDVVIGTFTEASHASGASVAGGGDVNGDGFPDIVQGAYHLAFGAPGPGHAAVFTFGCPPDAAYPYCDTSPNAASAVGARIGKLGSTSLTGPGLRLYATDCPPNNFALFFHGASEGHQPLGNGVLCVGGNLVRLNPPSPTAATGTPTHQLDPASLGVAAGTTRFFQCWLRDPAPGGAGYNFSDGLRVTFCP